MIFRRRPRLLWLFPFVIGVVLGSGLGARLRAHACECVPDGFWVLERAAVDANDPVWPAEGHVYPDQLSLWAPGENLTVEYAP